MIILGVSPPAHESAVGLVIDGRLVAAASEERFTRVKNQGGFPRHALETVLKLGGVEAKDIDVVALAWLEFGKEQRLKFGAFLRNVPYVLDSDLPVRNKALHLLNYGRNVLLDRHLFHVERGVQTMLLIRGELPGIEAGPRLKCREIRP